MNEASPEMSRKVLITGVNKGRVPLEMARRGHTVIGCSPTQEMSLQSHNNHYVDVRSNTSVQELARTVVENKAIPYIIEGPAKELPSGIAIVALGTGVIRTDMLVSCFGAMAAHYQKPT